MKDKSRSQDRIIAELRQELEAQRHQLTLERAVQQVRAEAASMQRSADIARVMVAFSNGLGELGVRHWGVAVNTMDEEAGMMYCYNLWPEEMIPANTIPAEILVEKNALEGVHLVRGSCTIELARKNGWSLPGSEIPIWTAPEEFPDQLRALWKVDDPELDRWVGRSALNVPFSQGGLFVGALEGEVLGERELELVRPFAEAMDLGYMRYLDLEAAEKRNCQLALEAAVERVRATVMGMRSSEDLLEVVERLYREMLALGIGTTGCTIAFYAEDSIVGYSAGVNPRQYGLSWSENQKVREIDENMVLFSKPMKISLERIEKNQPGLLAVLRAGKVDTREIQMYTKEGVIEKVFPDLRGDLSSYREVIAGERTVTNVPFEYGFVGFNEKERNEEHIAIVRQLTDALGLGYVRYLDFQNLEQRNRDLEVERALEQVRAAVAGMEDSRGLFPIVRLVRITLQELGVSCEQVGINIIDEIADQVRFYDEGPPGDIRESEETHSAPIGLFGAVRELHEHWKKGEVWVRHLTRETIEKEIRNSYERSPETFAEGFGDVEEWTRSQVALFGDRWFVDVPSLMAPCP